MRVLFVCAGNTCRSPLAEATAKREGQLTSIEFGSAGWCAADGARANPYAVEVARAHGLDLAGHRARPLESVLGVYDLVLALDHRALQAATDLGVAGPSLLSAYAGDTPPREIDDPLEIGTRAAYERTYGELRRAVGRTVKRLTAEGEN